LIVKKSRSGSKILIQNQDLHKDQSESERKKIGICSETRRIQITDSEQIYINLVDSAQRHEPLNLEQNLERVWKQTYLQPEVILRALCAYPGRTKQFGPKNHSAFSI